MASLLKASGGTTSIFPSASWAAPNGLFSSTDRNDGSIYSYTDSTATVTLPSSDLADGYIFVAAYELHDTSNGRCMPQGKWVQASGTSDDFIATPTSGYCRDTSEDRAYVRCWGWVVNPSASSTYQFQWKRDADAPTGGTERSELWVIPVPHNDYAAYTSSSTSIPGGTTPTVIGSFTGTDGTNITISGGNIITATADNRWHIVLSAQFYEGVGNARTQRWHGLDIDGVQEDAAKGYTYYRNNNNDEGGEMVTWAFKTDTANVTIEQTCYRGDGVSNGDGGASADVATTASVGDHSIVVIELNESAEGFICRDTTVSSDLSSSPTDLEINTTTDEADSASFTDAGSDQSINVVQTSDVLFGANISGASNNVSSGARWTAYAEFHVNGTEDTDTFGGDYLRNDQSSNDTFGWSANLLSPIACTAGDDVGVSVTELSGTENGGNCISPAGWSGMWGINLDTLSAAASTTLDADSGSFVITGTAATLGIDAAFIMTAGAATEGNTTERLSMDQTFGGGKLGESVAELPTVDLGSDEDREDVWSISATSEAGNSSTYEFRVLYEGEVAQTITVTPEVTISVATTLDADSGSFVITGTDADTNITTPADSGSFVITGTAATTQLGYQLDADSGSFVITGTAADLQRSLLLAADSGSFVITGTAATLERSLILDADSGSFVITGTAADLERSLQLVADSGSFVITGTAAELLYSEVLEADSGSFVITGTEASLELGFVLNADSGSFVITGTDATPQLDYVLEADSGSFVITGTDASLELTGVTTLDADSGSFLITGTAADLLTSPVLDADSGSFLITGTDATMELGGAPTVDEQFSGGWEHKDKKKKKKKSSYEKQMEGLAKLPIINRHMDVELQVDKLIKREAAEVNTEEDDIKAIMLLIH